MTRPIAVSALDLVVEDRPWGYALGREAEIAADFETRRRRNPTLFNGGTLLLDGWRVENETFHGRFCRGDYASFLHWRDAHAAGRLDDLAGSRNLFGMPAVLSAEGHFLVAEMAAHTANAGRVYAPCGSLDPGDVRRGRVDIDGSMARELREETGLDLAEAEAEAGYTIWFDGPRVAVARVHRFAEPAASLAARARAHLAAEAEPELADIRFVAGISGIEAGRMQPYTMAFIRHLFGAG